MKLKTDITNKRYSKKYYHTKIGRAKANARKEATKWLKIKHKKEYKELFDKYEKEFLNIMEKEVKQNGNKI